MAQIDLYHLQESFMKKVKIALIDSGVNDKLSELANLDIQHIDIHQFQNFEIDETGHGTAIAYILSKAKCDLKIFSIKIFGNNKITTELDIIEALEFVYLNLEIDLIHISSGVVVLNYEDRFREVCNKISNKGITIVSAYDNEGRISYPAAFENVIGVHWNTRITNVLDYKYIIGSPVNVMGSAGKMRLLLNDGNFEYLSGSSYTSAYITKLIAEEKKGKSAHEVLVDNAKEITYFDLNSNNIQSQNYENVSKIEKAIIFPVNKETHSILGNIDLLKFEIVGVYDVKYSKNIGKMINDTVFGKSVLNDIIKTFESIDWDSDFDTIIIGHVSLLSSLYKTDLLENILKKCSEYKKNVYAFDSLKFYKKEVNEIIMNGNFVINLEINNEDVCNNSFGSLKEIVTPVIGVFGTSSQQGKFNLQLDLRRRFLADGYKIGQLGTEPSSYLLGFNKTYTIGYDNQTVLSSENEVFYVNDEIYNMRNVDIIIMGSQSNTVPKAFGNYFFYPLRQQNLLSSCVPDAIILAVNFTDNRGYIGRTVQYLKSYFGCKVIGFVLFPMLKEYKTSIHGKSVRKLTGAEIEMFKKESIKLFNIKTYLNGDDLDINDMYENIITFFSKC